MRSLCRDAGTRIDPLRDHRLPPWSGPIVSAQGHPMIDILLLALGVGIFGLMVAYAAGCERV